MVVRSQFVTPKHVIGVWAELNLAFKVQLMAKLIGQFRAYKAHVTLIEPCDNVSRYPAFLSPSYLHLHPGSFLPPPVSFIPDTNMSTHSESLNNHGLYGKGAHVVTSLWHFSLWGFVTIDLDVV